MKICGRDYKIPELGFGTIRQLEENGISIFDLQRPNKKFISIITAFVGLATGLEVEQADELLQQHLLGGGNFDGWLNEINKAVENSGFFQAMMKKEQKTAPTSKTAKKPKIQAVNE